MLKDEFPDVRLHIISKLELVNKGTLVKFTLISTLLRMCSHRYRPIIAISPSCYRSIGGRQAMAGAVGHHRIHPPPREPARRQILRRKAQHAMYELVRRYRLLNTRSRHPEPQEVDGGVRSRVGERSHHTKGHGNGYAHELLVPNDNLLRHLSKLSSRYVYSIRTYHYIDTCTGHQS